MAVYNLYPQDPNNFAFFEDCLQHVVGVIDIQRMQHDFMPPCITFSSTALSDEGIHQQVRSMVQREPDQPRYVLLKRLHKRHILI